MAMMMPEQLRAALARKAATMLVVRAAAIAAFRCSRAARRPWRAVVRWPQSH
jgi:hypothetical protein